MLPPKMHNYALSPDHFRYEISFLRACNIANIGKARNENKKIFQLNVYFVTILITLYTYFNNSRSKSVRTLLSLP